MNYELYACLPFVELKVSDVIMGPAHFWSARDAEKFLSPSQASSLREYLENVAQVKACSQDVLVNTVKIPAASITCISIDPKIPEEEREAFLVDAIYTFFFCSAFSHLFSGTKTAHFDVFTKILPASPTFLLDPSNWREAHILEIQREQMVELESFDAEMCHGLGHGLACAYRTDTCRSNAETAKVQGLMRSIRYFVDRFFGRFENLLGKGLNLSSGLNEAEDIVFLATSFEGLFDLSDQNPHIDFKHKLRPMLGLRFSISVENLWKWVDGFYNLREHIVHGRPLPDIVFRGNPNFSISYFFLGMKLFLYGVYWQLHSMQLILSEPSQFRWITVDKLLAFFWPEEALLRQTRRIVGDLSKDWSNKGLRHDLMFDAKVFMHIYDSHYVAEATVEEPLQWHPTPLEQIQAPVEEICSLLENAPTDLELPPGFLDALRERISSALL
ncbi:MAG: hypothetical protein Q8K75_02435 [Chlamydiales bacterium]|nr:hypothetical protein [Chlamydiales bacterium]